MVSIMVRVRNEMPYTATGKYTTETALQSKADQPLDIIYRHMMLIMSLT